MFVFASMKKIVLLSIWFFVFFLAWCWIQNNNILEDKSPNISTIKTLKISYGLSLGTWYFVNQLNDDIRTLKIVLEKHSIFDLDVSFLQKYSSLETLIIHTLYKNGETVIRDRAVTIEGLEKLTQLKKLIIFEFPITSLDMNLLPPHLHELALYYIWVENLMTWNILHAVPNIRIEIVGPNWWYNIHQGVISYW